jgi:hypothetical protein
MRLDKLIEVNETQIHVVVHISAESNEISKTSTGVRRKPNKKRRLLFEKCVKLSKRGHRRSDTGRLVVLQSTKFLLNMCGACRKLMKDIVFLDYETVQQIELLLNLSSSKRAKYKQATGTSRGKERQRKAENTLP